MPTYFIESDGEISISDLPHNNLINKDLQPGFYTYRVIKNPKGTIIKLDIEEEFKVPEKIYGTVKERSRLIINSYKEAKGNLGVLLQGLGGTGKTLLAKLICNSAYKELKIPVIMIKDIDSLKELGYLMNLIKTKAIVFIDEYEKIFMGDNHSRRDQSFILTLMDGTINSNFLFLLTINDIYQVNEHLLSRPGRIRYLFRYDGVSRNEVYHLCKDNLSHLTEDDLVKLVNIIETLGDKCTYDIIMSMINEIRLYPNEDFYSILMRLNTRHISDQYGLIDSFSPSLYIHKDLSLIDWLNNGLSNNVEKQETVSINIDHLFRKPLNYLENISNSIFPSFDISTMVINIHQLSQDIQAGTYTVSLRNVNETISNLSTTYPVSNMRNIEFGLVNTPVSIQKLAKIKTNHVLAILVKEIMLKSEELNGSASMNKVSYKLIKDYREIVKDVLSSELNEIIKEIKDYGNDLRQYLEVLRNKLENYFINELMKCSPYILFEYKEVKDVKLPDRDINPKELISGRKPFNGPRVTFSRRDDYDDEPF